MVQPVDDEDIEGDETVVITLTGAGVDYVIGGASSDVVTVVDDDTDDLVDAGGPYWIYAYAGCPVTLDGSATPPEGVLVVSYEWADGRFFGPSPVISWSELEALGMTPGNEYLITLKVNFDDGSHGTDEAVLKVRYPADVNGDDCVNVADMLSIRFDTGAIGEHLQGDVDCDGGVDVTDLLFVRTRLGTGACEE